MGKPQIPLLSIPLLASNRTENNGKMLRRPQRRTLQPLQQCLSPSSSPDIEEEHSEECEAGSPQQERPTSQHDIVDQWLLESHMAAGHSSPSGPGGPPPTGLGHHHQVPRPSLDNQAQYADGMQVSENLALKMQIGIKNTHNAMKSRPLPTSSAKKLLKTTVHTGPQGLPPPEPRKARNILPFETIIEKGPSEMAHLKTINVGGAVENNSSISVKGFLLSVAEGMHVAYENVQTVMFSRANFRELTRMIHHKLREEGNNKHGKITHKNLNQQVSQQDLPYRPSSHAVTGSRVPQTQILIQMASMLTEQIQATTEGRNIRALIRPFPKYTPSKPIDEMPRAEIILYEQSTPEEDDKDDYPLHIRGEGTDGAVIMRHTSEKHFMDSKRNCSPFGDAGLDPTDIAVLDALVTGGAVLSLKAHYIQTLPDISPIISSLRYLNLSFNNFTAIPPEVLTLSHLEVLKLRNNPIREIPDEIRHLKYLRTFELPFCLVADIPEGLLTLHNLQYLDLSYNKLTSLPHDMKRLKSLQVLFVEGNQLVALPCSCLAIHNLRYVRVRNNFMHRIFWPEFMKHNDQPQKLEDLTGLLIKQLEIDVRYGEKIPQAAKELLSKVRRCDCCHGPLVGEGLTLIRPGSLFGVRNVPFMFKSCSPYCARLFMANKANLLELVDND